LTKVSVIISTYSTERFREVLECINSLKKQTLQPNEIILVLDPNEELRDFYSSRVPSDVKIVISEERGLSNARNTGIMMASGDIVAFIDDDAMADKDWLKNLVKNFDDPYILGVGGLVKPIWEDGRPKWFPEELWWVVGCSYKGLPEHKSYVRNPIGCNMAFRKYVFERVGYFKSNIGRLGKRLIGSEEAEISIRILKAIPGAKIVYDPSAIVYHKVPRKRASLRYLIKRSFYEGISKALILEKSSSTTSVLNLEYGYLKYLLLKAIPTRLMRPYKIEYMSQFLALILSILSVLSGYLAGKLMSLL